MMNPSSDCSAFFAENMIKPMEMTVLADNA
jgi:hypothetical protein